MYREYKIIVETKYPELFINNPYPDWVTNLHFKTTGKFLKPKYVVDCQTNQSIYLQMLSYIQVTEIRAPKLYLSENEIKIVEANYPKPYIVIAPVGKTKFSANRKEWGVEKFQMLVDRLTGIRVLQIGMPEDPPLKNVIDARIVDLRKTAAIISNSELFIGLEGGLMHLARAVDKPAVIIYGGYIKPEISGYDLNINIASVVECSPCYNSNIRQKECSHMQCMQKISVEQVYTEVQKKLKEIIT